MRMASSIVVRPATTRRTASRRSVLPAICWRPICDEGIRIAVVGRLDQRVGHLEHLIHGLAALVAGVGAVGAAVPLGILELVDAVAELVAQPFHARAVRGGAVRCSFRR